MTEDDIVYHNGPMVAVRVRGGIEIRCHSSSYTHSVAVGMHKGDPRDGALVAKARLSVDRMAHYLRNVRRMYGIL